METTIPKQLASIIEAIPQLILAYEVGTIMGVCDKAEVVYIATLVSENQVNENHAHKPFGPEHGFYHFFAEYRSLKERSE